MRAIYARLSRDATGHSTSTTEQLAECRSFCERRGWADVHEFVDNDVSASGSKPRPAWTEMLRHLDDIDAIVCWSSDRLYRQPRDLEVLIDRAERGALTIHALHSSELDLGTPEGRAVARTLAAWNRAEVERLGARVSRKKQALIAEGRPTGGRRVFGYERDGLTIVTEEAALVREALSNLLSGASVNGIVRDWNARGLGTTTGSKWTPSGLKRILRNPRIAGLHPSTGEKAAWKAIVRKADWEAAQDLFNDPARQKFQSKGDRYILGGGLATCGVCGGKLSGRPSNGTRLYICKATGAVHLGIAADRLERHVLALADEHDNSRGLDVVADPATLSAPLLEALDKAEAELEEWGRMRATGEVTPQEFRGGRKVYVARIAARWRSCGMKPL